MVLLTFKFRQMAKHNTLSFDTYARFQYSRGHVLKVAYWMAG